MEDWGVSEETELPVRLSQLAEASRLGGRLRAEDGVSGYSRISARLESLALLFRVLSSDVHSIIMASIGPMYYIHVE